MRDIIVDLQKSGVWKVQLTTAINVIYSKHVDEEHAMHSKSDNKELKTYDIVNNFVDELFKTLLSRYQSSSDTSMRRSNFIFHSV